MNQKIKIKNGKEIVIRSMQKDEILPGGSGRCLANIKIKLNNELHPTDNFKLLNEKLIEKYDASTILALDKNTVIGFVNFYPTWCPHFDICQDEQINDAIKHLNKIVNPPICDDPALHPRCLIISKEYRGNNISIELLNYLTDWAKYHGWKKIVANGCIFSGMAMYQWLISPKPPKPIWEKVGYSSQDYPELNLKAKSSIEDAKKSFDWYKSYDFSKYSPKDIKDDNPNWYEIFADYTMVLNI